MNWIHNPKYVNLPTRFVASWIDQYLVYLIGLYPLTILAKVTDINQLIPTFMALLAIIWLPMLLLIPLCYCLLLSKWGTTPGKYVCGIRIADKTGKPLTFKLVVFRELIAKRVSEAMLMLGYLKITIDPNHQGWHDTVSESFAYKTNIKSYLGIIILLLLSYIQYCLIHLIITTFSANASLIGDLQFLIAPILDLLK